MSLSVPRIIPSVFWLALSVGPQVLLAQIDYRNLDANRPSRVTDAYPVERFAFEFSIPYAFSGGEGLTGHFVSPRLDVGVARNIAVDAGLDFDAKSGDGVVEVGALWNLRRETPGLPAFSISAESAVPFGGASSGAQVRVGVLATRSFGPSRAHLNAAVATLGSDIPGARTGPLWWAGVAWDRTFFRSSTLGVIEVTAEREAAGTPTEWTAGVGLRRQVTPTWVFLGGISRALGRRPLGTTVRVGLSHVFGIAALMRGAR